MLEENAASCLLLGIVSIFKVFSGFLVCEFAFWLSKPEKEREWKLRPWLGRGGSFVRAGPGELSCALAEDPVVLPAPWPTTCSLLLPPGLGSEPCFPATVLPAAPAWPLAEGSPHEAP